MNVLNVIEDMAHLSAIIILLLKIWNMESCAGKFLLSYLELAAELGPNSKIAGVHGAPRPWFTPMAHTPTHRCQWGKFMPNSRVYSRIDR